jgi:three-Cys-motif partner protein
MSTDADKFFTTIQPAAILKHELLRRYLPVFVFKTGSTTGRVAYIDGYAGPGVYGDGSPGSPAIAIDVARIVSATKGGERVDGYLVEEDKGNHQALRQLLAEEGLGWTALHGDVVKHLPTIIAGIPPTMPVFALLDPFGLGIPFTMLRDELLARSGNVKFGYRVEGAATEVLINFSIPGLRRNAGHLESTSTNATYLKARDTILETVDQSMGGDWWRELWLAGGDDRIDAIYEEYKRRILGLAGKWTVYTVPVSDRWNGPADYNLMLLTQHPDGAWHFNEALSGSLELYRARCHEAAGQLDLEPLAEREAQWVAEIEGNIRGMLAKGRPFTVGKNMTEVYGEAIGYARELHIRRAIKALHAAGETPTNGKGGIQKMRVLPPS